MRECLFAYTAHDVSYPPFINVSVEDGRLMLTVRAAADPSGACGACVKVDVPRDQADALGTALGLGARMVTNAKP